MRWMILLPSPDTVAQVRPVRTTVKRSSRTDNLDNGLSTCDLPGDQVRGQVGGVDVQEASRGETPPTQS